MANYAKIATELLTHLEVMDEKKCDCCGHTRESLVRFTNESIAGKTDMCKSLSAAIYKAAEEVTIDYAYLFTKQSLQLIVDCDPETEEGLREDVESNLEPEHWYNKLWTFGSQNTEVVNANFPESDRERGIEGVLQWAYSEAQRNVFTIVADLVVELADEQEDN